MDASWHTAAGLNYLQVDPEAEADDLPVIIALHGRGADPSDLVGLAYEVNPGGYRWLLPQAPLPLPIGPRVMGWAWYSREDNDRAASVIAAREQIQQFLTETLAGLGIPRNRAALIGFSQGGAMALHVGVSSAEPFGAIVAMSGYLPAPESLGALPASPTQKILMVHGTQDQVLSISLAREARALLERAGFPLEYREFTMDHQITAESLATVARYLHSALPPGPVA